MPRKKKEEAKPKTETTTKKTKRKEKSEEYIKYQRYIRSKQFDEVRSLVKERDKVCQCCGRTQEDIDANPKLSFNAHHRSYQHLFEGGHAEAQDVILLCSICHRAIHRAPSNFSRFSH